MQILLLDSNSNSVSFVDPKDINPNSTYIFCPRDFSMRFTETYTPLGPKRKGINPWNYWSNEEKFESIRLKRNYILNQTDWIAFPDVPHPKKQAWLDYRQALRNIPQDFIDPDEVVWPTEP